MNRTGPDGGDLGSCGSSACYAAIAADPASIVVSIDGAWVDEGVTDGWTYDEPLWTVVLHGASRPAEGATVWIDWGVGGAGSSVTQPKRRSIVNSGGAYTALGSGGVQA